MIRIDVKYEGSLKCSLSHGPSGSEIVTDAPKDNMGEGSSFSPTDLCAASLASCMVTTMGIAAKRHGFELGDCTAVVEKHMTAVPTRRISALPVQITLLGATRYTEEQVSILHNAAATCPVKESLSPSISIPITWASE